jgi:hypothetical protein
LTASAGVALVVGATGVTGTPLTEELLLAGWPVVAVSRRAPMLRAEVPGANLRHVGVDLADAQACGDKLGTLNDVTHLFYCGHAPDAPTRLGLGSRAASRRSSSCAGRGRSARPRPSSTCSAICWRAASRADASSAFKRTSSRRSPR